jgi:hypothetical protein
MCQLTLFSPPENVILRRRQTGQDVLGFLQVHLSMIRDISSHIVELFLPNGQQGVDRPFSNFETG